MELRVFQSDKGDCVLYTGGDGKNILVDGGMAKSYRKHVAGHLEGLTLDLLCVSHTDQDHIQGILELMDNIKRWRVYEYQKSRNNNRARKPNIPRPPEVLSVWHNAFNDSVSDNDGRIEDMLAAASASFSKHDLGLSKFVLSKREAIMLSNRLKPNQLGIPLNREFNGKLVYYEKGTALQKVGKTELTIIGPFKEDLEKLRKEWNVWLRESAKTIEKLRKKAIEDADSLGNPAMAMALGEGELGNRAKVSVPNLASIMFLLEAQGKSVLFTGDGHGEDIIKGLKATKKIKEGGGIHLDVLKVQHHGSEHNLDSSFCRMVTADHYVFCGNGAHDNPELPVIRAILDSRMGKNNQKSKNKEVERPFKLWFNSSDTNTTGDESKHMAKVKRYVAGKARSSRGRMSYFFMPKGRHSFVIDL